MVVPGRPSKQQCANGMLRDPSVYICSMQMSIISEGWIRPVVMIVLMLLCRAFAGFRAYPRAAHVHPGRLVGSARG